MKSGCAKANNCFGTAEFLIAKTAESVFLPFKMLILSYNAN